MIERRKFMRIPQSTEISYEIADKPEIHAFLIRNISQGGISFFVHKFIPQGTILKIRFSLVEFSYDGFVKVAWIREVTYNEKYEVGAEFMNMPAVS